MNNVSQVTYDNVKYPWQSSVLEAFREFDAEQLLNKIGIAEAVIAKRLAELNGAGDEEEIRALHDVQNTLAILKSGASDLAITSDSSCPDSH